MKPRDQPPAPCQECQDIFADFNKLSGRKYRVVGDAARYAHQRHLDYSTETCKAVAKFKYLEWRSDPEMARYADPLTIFRISNFDRYVNQMEAAEEESKQHSRKNETFEDFLERKRGEDGIDR